MRADAASTSAPATPDVVQLSPFTVATIHPAAILRAEDREAQRAGFVADLRVVRELLDELRGNG